MLYDVKIISIRSKYNCKKKKVYNLTGFLLDEDLKNIGIYWFVLDLYKT